MYAKTAVPYVKQCSGCDMFKGLVSLSANVNLCPMFIVIQEPER